MVNYKLFDVFWRKNRKDKWRLNFKKEDILVKMMFFGEFQNKFKV
jgi:hypothetical protein